MTTNKLQATTRTNSSSSIISSSSITIKINSRPTTPASNSTTISQLPRCSSPRISKCTRIIMHECQTITIIDLTLYLLLVPLSYPQDNMQASASTVGGGQ